MKAIARAITWHRALAASVALTAVCGFAETPDYFLEWVESKSNLYVDTGIRGRCGTKAEVRFANLGGDTHHAMLAAAKITNGTWAHLGFCTMWGQSMRFWYGGTYASDGYGYVPWGGDYLTEVEASTTGALSGKTTKADGTFEVGSVDWSANSGVIDTGTSLYLFAEHSIDASSGTEGVSNYSLARFYHAKIWQIPDDGTEYVLVSDLRPCMKDGVAGVYDAVTDTILYPQGNALKAGPAKYDSSWPAAARVGTIDHPATQYGRIHYAQRGGMGNGTWKYIDLIDYTFMGEGDSSKLNGAGGSWQDNNLKFSQLRFDGWFYVDSAKAGSWAINQKFDDYFAFFIDNANVLYNNGYSGEANSTVAVAEGWHRFTIICGDTYGGYGSNKNFGGDIGSVPFVIAVNGATYAFNTANFTQGSGLNRVTLEADADWSDRGDVILASGAVLDLNGHNLTVKDIVCDDYVGAVVTNSTSKKSVLYFAGEPLESKAYIDSLIKEVDVKIILAKNGDQVATWTGAANDGDPTNANNWEDLADEPVVPTAAYTVKIVGNNVNLQAPAGTDIACKVFEIGNCTLTTDCDWRGLSVKPTIVGTANLDGHVLKLNNLSAVAGSAFSGGEGSTVEFAPPSEGTTYAKMGESAFIDNIANLTTSGDVKFLLSKDGAGGTLTVTELDLGKMHYAEFVQTNGAVNLGNVWCAIGGKDNAAGHGVYRMTGGTLTAAKDFTVGSKGVGEFIQTSGNVTLNNWFNIGRNGGRGTYTITGGAMTNTYNNTVFVGAEGGTGTINIDGDASVNFYRLTMGGFDTKGNKGYINLSGNGSFVTRSWGTIGTSKNGYGEVNQSGGLFSIGAEFTVGQDGTGVYNLTDGELRTSGHLWVGRTNVTTSKGTFTQGAGTVACNDLRIGEGAGSVGTYTQNDGMVLPYSWERIGMSGVGTHVQNGGTNYFARKVDNWLKLGENTTGVGTYILNDGLLDVFSGIVVGISGTAAFTQNAGMVSAGVINIATSSGGVGTYTQNGGTVVTPGITGGSGTSAFFANGGTIVATNVTDGANFISGLDNVTYGPGGLTLDTAGYDVTMATVSDANIAAAAGSTFTKTGSGTLTVAAVPPVWNMVVSNGTLALSASCDNTAPVGIAHRWSFNGEGNDYTDSITGTSASTFGNADKRATTGGKLVLNGNGSGQGSLNLGKGLLGLGNATIEIWASNDAVKNWARVFDYGNGSYASNPGQTDCFLFAWSTGTDATKDIVQLKKDNVAVINKSGTMMSVMELGTQYYFAFTFKANGDGSTTVKWMRRNAVTGELERSEEATVSDWTLATLFAKNPDFWLGVSKYSADSDANASYDEVRIWNGALSDEAIALSAQKGPDATAADIAEVVAATSADSGATRALTLESGATLSIGAGNTLRQPVLNVGGTLAGGNLVVTERMNVTIGETMSVTDGATLDLTGAELVVTNPEALQKGFTFATAPSGGIVPAAPRPLSGDLRGYRLFLSRTKARIGKPGFTFIVR